MSHSSSPVLPAPAVQAATSRQSYAFRSDSLSPQRHLSPSRTTFGSGPLESRGRGTSTDRESVTTSTSRYSTSRSRSRAPLLRSVREENGNPPMSRFKIFDNPAASSTERPHTERELEDWRAELPTWMSRYLGYRPPDEPGPMHKPIWLLQWLNTFKIPFLVEVCLSTFVSCFAGVALICLAAPRLPQPASPLTEPLILASFGATAIIVYAIPLSPVASPRALVGGHIIAALVAVIVNRIWVAAGGNFADENLSGELRQQVWLSGALALGITAVLQTLTKTIHPPGGAIALLGTVTPGLVAIEFRFIAIVMTSVAIMGGVALLIGNVGRRRYPPYWWAPPPPKYEDQVKRMRTYRKHDEGVAVALLEEAEEFLAMEDDDRGIEVIRTALRELRDGRLLERIEEDGQVDTGDQDPEKERGRKRAARGDRISALTPHRST